MKKPSALHSSQARFDVCPKAMLETGRQKHAVDAKSKPTEFRKQRI
jgi:hypothetical protein